MKIVEFLENYNLHDSVVESITFYQNEKRVVMDMDLCNWLQSFYEDGDPEIKVGQLEFTEVISFKTEPKVFTINSNEIIDVSVLRIGSENETIKFVLTSEEDVIIVEIEAEGVDWFECVN